MTKMNYKKGATRHSRTSFDYTYPFMFPGIRRHRPAGIGVRARTSTRARKVKVTLPKILT